MAVRHRPAVALAVLIAALALPASASARFYGSSLRRPANVNFGCEVAPFFNTFSPSGFSFGASGHRTCTWRPLGYLGRLGTGGTLASNGIIRRVQIRAGRRPAPLRLTILQSSSRLSRAGERSRTPSRAARRGASAGCCARAPTGYRRSP